MKALISPNEIARSYNYIPLGIRVVQINTEEFPVAEPLFWIDCEDTVVPEEVYYDSEDNTIKQKPIEPVAVVCNPKVDEHSEI
jgi:hypothetical protein